MDQVVELCLEGIRNHRIQDCVHHLKGLRSALSGEDAGKNLIALPSTITAVLKEGLSSQALVNHSEGGGAILGLLSSYLATVAARAVEIEKGRASRRDYSVVSSALAVCKQVLRYNVKILFFFAKSGSIRKQVDVMVAFTSMCKLGDWVALDVMKRVDWAKVIGKCKGYSFDRKELRKLRASKKRQRGEMEKENEDNGGGGGLDPSEHQQPTKGDDDQHSLSARQAYIEFVLTLVRLDQHDLWDRMASLPILLKTLLNGLLGEDDPRTTRRVVGVLKSHLFGGRHWKRLSMHKRHRLVQQQHVRILCDLADAHADGSDVGGRTSDEVFALLLNLMSRDHAWTLFPLGEQDYLACVMISQSNKLDVPPCLHRALGAAEYPSVAAMVTALREYSLVVNKSLRYARNLGHAKWFDGLLCRDSLAACFLFMHLRRAGAHQQSVIDLAAAASFLEWMAKTSLVLRVASGLGKVFRSIEVNALGTSLCSEENLTIFLDACISSLVLPATVVDKNAVMVGLQGAVLHDNTLALHKLLQLYYVLVENCSKFLEILRNHLDAPTHEACTNTMKAKMLQLLPDMKFLVAIHVHIRDQLYHRKDDEPEMTTLDELILGKSNGAEGEGKSALGPVENGVGNGEAKIESSSRELVLLQSLRCLRILGEAYTKFGYNWGDVATKCLSDDLSGFTLRHKVELLSFLQLAADSNQDVTFSSSWKVLSALLGVLLEDHPVDSGKTRALRDTAQGLVTKVLMNTSLFEAYPAEVGIWLHNLRLAKRKLAGNRDLRALLVDFFSQAVYKTTSKVTDLVYFVGRVAAKRKSKTNLPQRRSESFGPLLLLVIQQSCSFLSSQKRSAEEKSAIAEYVCAVSMDLATLSESALLHRSVSALLKDAKSSGTKGLDSHAKTFLGPLLKLEKAQGGGGWLLTMKKLAQASESESLDVLTFFNLLRMTRQSIDGGAPIEAQISMIRSLQVMLNQGRVPVGKIDQYQSTSQWLETLSAIIDRASSAVQAGTQAALALNMQTIALTQQVIGLLPGHLKSKQDHMALYQRYLCLLVSTPSRVVFSLDRIRCHTILEVLGKVFFVEDPSNACCSSLFELLGHLLNKDDDDDSAKKAKIEYQLCILCALQHHLSHTKGPVFDWLEEFALGAVKGASNGLASLSASVRGDLALRFFHLLADFPPLAMPLVPCVSPEIMRSALLETKSGQMAALAKLVDQAPDLIVKKWIEPIISKSWISNLKPSAFAGLGPCLVKYFRGVASTTGSGDAGACERDRKVAKACFGRAVSLVVSMDLDPSAAHAVAALASALLEASTSLRLNLSKVAEAFKGAKISSSSQKEVQLRLPFLMSLACAVRRAIPESARAQYALSLLAYFERTALFPLVLQRARSAQGCAAFLGDVLDMTSLLVDQSEGRASQDLREFLGGLMPVYIKKTLKTGAPSGLLDKMSDFASGLQRALAGGRTAQDGLSTQESPGHAQWLVQYTTEIVDLLVSHSEFRNFVFEEKQEEAEACENRLCMDSVLVRPQPPRGSGGKAKRRAKLYQSVASLMRIGHAFSLYDTEDGKRQCEHLHLMLLSAYSGHSGPGDAALLDLMAVLCKRESQPLACLERHHYLWGEGFRKFYILSKDGETTTSGDAAEEDGRDALGVIVSKTHLNKEIRVDRMIRTIHLVLGASDLVEVAYDTRVLLAFTRHHVGLGTLSAEEAISKGLLSLAFASLASAAGADLRALAGETIEAFAGATGGFDFKDSKLIEDMVRRMGRIVATEEGEDGEAEAAEGGKGVAERIPAPVAVLCAELVPSVMSEASLMHATAKKLIGRESTFDATSIPVFLDLLHVCSPDYLHYQKWLLRYLSLSLSHAGDFGPFRKRFAFEVLMGFASAPFSRTEILLDVLGLLRKASGVDRFLYELISKRNVVSWLAGLLTRTDGAGRGGEDAAGVRDRVLETMNAFLAAAKAKRQEVDLPMLRDVERALGDLGDGREGEDGPAEATRRLIADIASQDSV